MSDGKRILVFAGAAYMYGAEKVTLEVMRFLRSSGYQLYGVVNGWNDGVFIGKLQQEGITYSSIKLGWYYFSQLKWSWDSLIHYPGAVSACKKLFRNFKPDIIYVTSYRPVILLYPFLGNKKLLYHVHDPLSETKQGRFFIRKADKKIQHYIAVSDFIKQDLVSCGIQPDKITVIHNSVMDVPLLAETQRTYMPEGRLRIGIIGQVIPRKGHEDLIDALQLINNDIPFSLAIFGGGDDDYIAALKRKIATAGLDEKVVWKGVVKNKTDIYPLIDVMVAPTRNNEPFALVALEAGYFSVPAVVTKSGGFPESIVDGSTGFIINRQSPQEIAEKLKIFFNNPALLPAMGSNAKENISRNFLPDMMKSKIKTLFTKL